MHIYKWEVVEFWHLPHPADRHASNRSTPPRLVSPVPVVHHHRLESRTPQGGSSLLQVFPAGLGLAGLILWVLSKKKTHNTKGTPSLCVCHVLEPADLCPLLSTPLRPFLRPQTSSLSYLSLLSLRGAHLDKG